MTAGGFNGTVFKYVESQPSSSSSPVDPSSRRPTAVENKKLERKLIQHFNWRYLEDNCKLYKEFKTGTRRLSHDEVPGVALNLACIRGGDSRFETGIDLRENRSDWYRQYKYIKRVYDQPRLCGQCGN